MDGYGEVVSLSCLSSLRLRQTIQRVLTEGFYIDNALKLKESIRKAGGVKRTADIVEQAIQLPSPEMPQVLQTVG